MVFESPTLPIEWGVRELRDAKDARCLALVTDLLHRFQPDVVVIEDTAHPACRRCARVRILIDSIRPMALSRKVGVVSVNRDQVLKGLGADTKHQAATRIAARLPELAPSLPPFRKPWMSEDPRMSLFDAAAFALTFYHSLR
ncbi:MAG: hypothetical protein GHCLOJNM_00184 [bacterium]|nr:hypothetical protein [bacterium]